jgi:hypothetical protein
MTPSKLEPAIFRLVVQIYIGYLGLLGQLNTDYYDGLYLQLEWGRKYNHRLLQPLFQSDTLKDAKQAVG